MSFRRRMHPLPLSDIKITDRFWSRWQRVVSENSLPAQYELLESKNRLANFRRAAGKEEGSFLGKFWFNDSDVYKWLEASAYALANHDHATLRKQVDDTVALVLEAQEPSGYLNTFFQLKHPDLKYKNLVVMHEMYCGGHFIEAGVALFQSLGDRKLLDGCIKYADHLLDTFGPEKRRGYCGHEEIELSLIKLSKITGNSAYRNLARYMVDQRGVKPTVFEAELKDPESLQLFPTMPQMMNDSSGNYSGEYAQDHAPVCEHNEVVGHAVRAMYLYTAVADLAGDQEDRSVEAALERAWSNLTRKRMYITGGIGPSRQNEGFTTDYDLPNLTAYAETCAACGLIFWGQSMLEQTASGQYADVIERALYNGAISGISLDGKGYFYDNPLESRGKHQRVPWFDCACCPPNIARLIGNLASYVFGIGEDEVFVNQFTGFDASFNMGDVPVRVRCESEFPWEGKVKISVDPQRPVQFALKIRIPEWADDVSTDLPGAEEAEYEDGYAVFFKEWQKGDVLSIEIEMPPLWVEANPKVRDSLGRTAMTRGPLVYCAESVDNGFAPQTFSVDIEADLEIGFEEKLEGVITIRAAGYRIVEEDSDELYSPFGTSTEMEGEIILVPYYAWANRGKSEMQVWLRA